MFHAAKPKVHPMEVMDPNDPDSMYFIYICTKQKDLVLKKKIKLKKIKAAAEKKRRNPLKKKAPKL